MKTSTEYRKHNHKITQDEDKQTEEIELRKLRKSSVKVFKQRYEQAHNIVMRKWKSWGNRTSKLSEDNDLIEGDGAIGWGYGLMERSLHLGCGVFEDPTATKPAPSPWVLYKCLGFYVGVIRTPNIKYQKFMTYRLVYNIFFSSPLRTELLE